MDRNELSIVGLYPAIYVPCKNGTLGRWWRSSGNHMYRVVGLKLKNHLITLIIHSYGVKMKIYLDNCCYNRPFDKPSHVRIVNEANAKMAIQRSIADGKMDLVISYILYSRIREDRTRWQRITILISCKDIIRKITARLQSQALEFCK